MRVPVPADPELHLDAVFNRLQGDNELGDSTIGLALSGGGYRATLFATGAIAALVDGGLWPQVRWVASVSGGSFANAVAAEQLGATPGETEVGNLLRFVVERCAAPGSLAHVPKLGKGIRGPAIIARAYQAGIARNWLRSTRDAPRLLRDLGQPDRLHAFLAVDLSSLQPVFLSNRLVHSIGAVDEGHVAHEPGQLPLATAIRASATFPLMPAVRVSEADLGKGHFPLYEDLMLGDGGVWNNLGTNWEEQIRWLRRDILPIPQEIPERIDFHVVVDASAPSSRPAKWRTRFWPVALDRPLLSADRSLKAAFQSTLSSSRRALADEDGFVPRRVALISLEDIPRDVQILSALLGGAAPEAWREVSAFNQQVGTIGPTLRGVPREAAIHLLAHGYAQMAAALTVRGVPFEQFDYPHPRIRRALGSDLT